MVDDGSFDLIFVLDARQLGGPAQSSSKHKEYAARNLMAYINARLDASFAPLHATLPQTLPKIISRKVSKDEQW